MLMRSARSGECRGGTPRIVGCWDCRPAKNSPGCRAERGAKSDDLLPEVLGPPPPQNPSGEAERKRGGAGATVPAKPLRGGREEKRGPQGPPPPHQKNLLPFAAKYSIINGHDNKNAREGGRAVPQGRNVFLIMRRCWSCATGLREPCQAGNRAALSGSFCAPQVPCISV